MIGRVFEHVVYIYHNAVQQEDRSLKCIYGKVIIKIMMLLDCCKQARYNGFLVYSKELFKNFLLHLMIHIKIESFHLDFLCIYLY